MQECLLDPKQFALPRWEYWHYFKGLWRERKAKALYKQFQKHWRRPWSRDLLRRFSNPPKGLGLEIGVGARTIAPVSRTILADGYEEHGRDQSIAQVFFPAARIPFADATFDFILSEHTLEHLGNPLRALYEWLRVIKPGGHLILFLPHHDRTNDQLRPLTTLSHLIEDFENGVPDDDTTHVDEWIANVSRAGGIPEHYRHIAKQDLARTGSIHHHTWTGNTMAEVLRYVGMAIPFCEEYVPDRTDSFVIVGKK